MRGEHMGEKSVYVRETPKLVVDRSISAQTVEEVRGIAHNRYVFCRSDALLLLCG